MNNLEPHNWLDEAMMDLLLFKNTYREYKPKHGDYLWRKWVRT